MLFFFFFFFLSTQRLRYFMLAKRKPSMFAWTPQTLEPLRFVPHAGAFVVHGETTAPLSDFLEAEDSPECAACRVPDALVIRKGVLFGIRFLLLSLMSQAH